MPESGITLESLTLRGLPERVQALLRLKGVQMESPLPAQPPPELGELASDTAVVTVKLNTPRGTLNL